jgi:hypothetical protein
VQTCPRQRAKGESRARRGGDTYGKSTSGKEEETRHRVLARVPSENRVIVEMIEENRFTVDRGLDRLRGNLEGREAVYMFMYLIDWALGYKHWGEKEGRNTEIETPRPRFS